MYVKIIKTLSYVQVCKREARSSSVYLLRENRHFKERDQDECQKERRQKEVNRRKISDELKPSLKKWSRV
jgi:hypothetical protein